MLVRIITISIGIALLSASPAPAASTPPPGGANQVAALSGAVGQTIFNGVLRVKVVEVRDATPSDHPEQALPTPDQKVMVMTVLLRNGLHEDFIDLVEYTLADADDVTFNVPTSRVNPSNVHIQQGAAVRQSAMFVVDRNYVPTKLLVQCATCGPRMKFRNLRITIAK